MIRTFTQQDVDRFWKYVQKTETCWIWTGAKLDGNYGAFQLNGKCIGAHLFSYLIHFGQIDEGLLVRHSCDNPPCVYPDHLLIGTNQDNVQDRVTRRREAVGERVGLSKLTASKVQEIRLDLRSFTEIALEYEITAGEVGHIKHRRIWKHLPGEIAFGNKRCKLTDVEILDILYDNRSHVEIASAHGIGTNAVWYIKHGVTHRHITQEKV
jgi:hypothetical protein